MRHVLAVVFAAVIAVSGDRLPAVAQTSDEVQALRRAVEQLRESQQRIEKDLAEIKGLLRGRQAAAPPEDDPKSVVLAVDGAPFKGDPNAKLVLVEFTDYQ